MRRQLRLVVAAVFSCAPLAGGQSIFDESSFKRPEAPGASSARPPATTAPTAPRSQVPTPAPTAIPSPTSTPTPTSAGSSPAGAGVPERRFTVPRGPGRPAPLSRAERLWPINAPTIPWAEATRGVMRLTSTTVGPVAAENASAAATTMTTAGQATTPATGAVAPTPGPNQRDAEVQARRAEATRARYAPLVTEKDVSDFEEVYGADVRRAAGSPAAQLALAQTLRAAAGQLGRQPEMRRYVLLRAFLAARAGNASLTEFYALGEDLLRAIDTATTPAGMVQRVELADAFTEIWTDARRAVGSMTPHTTALEGAARDEYDLALWQMYHNYFEEARRSLDRARRFADAGKVDELTGPLAMARQTLEERVAARERYVRLAGQLAGQPDDAGANAEMARLIIAATGDLREAVEAAGRSGDPALRAVADAYESTRDKDPVRREYALGTALAGVVEHASGRERASVAAVAMRLLEAYVRTGDPDDPEKAKANLYLSRLAPVAKDAPGFGPRTEPPPLSSIPRRGAAVARAGEGAAGSSSSSSSSNGAGRGGERRTPGGNSASGSGTTGTGTGGATGPARQPEPAAPVTVAVTGPPLVDPAARRVAFVVDASGSMINGFDAVRVMIEGAVGDLRPPRMFNCVVFAAEATVGFQRAPVVASDSNKLTFHAFLGRLSAHGESEPVAALRAAFAQNPDAVYLISDGNYPDNGQVMREIRRLNAGRRTKIHTVCVSTGGPPNDRFMAQVAEENGGTSRELSMRGLQAPR